MTQTKATIVADSVSPAGHRLTTFECVFPRIVLAEVNTHRMLSRNSASSRAIPVADMLKRVLDDPYVPIHWGKNQKGMSADEDLSEQAIFSVKNSWIWIRNRVMEGVNALTKDGLHKQIANRPLEAFMWHTAVISGTEWSNFFNLRDTKDAHPDFRDLAHEARELYSRTTPDLRQYDEWHAPFVHNAEISDLGGRKSRHIAEVSIGRCARVSYDRLHEEETPEKSKARCDGMLSAGHMSPFEHVARPMTQQELDMFEQKKLRWDDELQRWYWVGALWSDGGRHADDEEGAITCYQLGEHTHFLGNLNGWIQYRKLIPHEEDVLGART